MAQSKHVIQTTDDNFAAEVLQSKEPALVDFWAEWCGPCRMLGPTIELIAGEMAGKLKVCKMNVDDCPNTPTQFHIRGIPTLILFKGGEVIDQLVGNQSKDAIVEMINKHL